MALRTLMLRKKLDEKKKALEELRAKDFAQREAELAQSIEEASTDEEKAVVEEAVGKFEAEKKENDDAVNTLAGEVEQLEADLAAAEEEQPKPEERKENKEMTTRENVVVEDIFKREDMQKFLGEIRSAIKEKRAISNVGLTIPEVMLPMVRAAIESNSKLISYVTKRNVAGTARQNIMGTVGEAIWTEMRGKLNELGLGFNNVDVDGFKVGGFFAICNADIEDSDENLTQIIVSAIGEAIGIALDKAIVYGKGVKMPLGFVTRLAQTTAPSDYAPTARPWVDLHETNVITGSGAKGMNLFKEIVANTKVAKKKYAKKSLVFIMNHDTHLDLLAESMDKNVNAAIVAGINSTMPVVGGDIVELEFMADGDIAFGYLDLYLLAERAGTQIGQSEHVKFVEDQTVVKGTARYDGTPVIAEAFGIMSIGTTAPTTVVTFAADTANQQ